MKEKLEKLKEEHKNPAVEVSVGYDKSMSVII